MNVIDSAVHLADIYARALFELARQAHGGLAERSKAVNAIKDDLDIVQDISVQEENFGALMTSPYFAPEHKQQILLKIFSGKLSDLTVDFLRVVIRHDRMIFLPRIISRFGELWEAHHGYKIVQVTVSKAMNDQQTGELSTNIANAMNSKVKLQIGINPSIMGGIIIRYGDRVIDNSIRGRLRRAVNIIMSKQEKQEKINEV